MRKMKYIIGILLLFLIIGFATITISLGINANTKITSDVDDFKVYYSDAYVNGTQDLTVIDDERHISFETSLDTIGQKYVLDYDVTNGSKNYNADLEMVCTGGNEYLSVTNNFDDVTILDALDTRRGTLTLEMIKSNAGDDKTVTIECTINVQGVERTSLAEGEAVEPVTPVDEAMEFCNGKDYPYGMLNDGTWIPDDEPIFNIYGKFEDSYYLCYDEEYKGHVYGYNKIGEHVYTYSDEVQPSN